MTGHSELLKRLLPPVAYDPQAPNLGVEIEADGKALDAVRIAADIILAEADPRSTNLLLPEWERELGLPDPCVGVLQAVTARRKAVIVKLLMQFGQTPQFYIDLAAQLGYTVTVDEFFDPANLLKWRINAPGTTITESSCMSPCTEPLRYWGNELLECAMTRFKPSHTTLVFGYV